MRPCDGYHRGTYEVSKEKLEVVSQYLKDHPGIRIRKADIVRSTGLTKSQVEYVIAALSFEDPHLCEDDSGRLFYV